MPVDRDETTDSDLLAFARRAVRSEQPVTVVVVELKSIYLIHENPRYHRVQALLLRELADTRRGAHFNLSNGDVVIVLAQADRRAHASIADEIFEMVLRTPDFVDDGMRRKVRVFALPDQREEFRDWLARAIPAREIPVRAMPASEASTGAHVDVQRALHPSDPIAGSLTPEALDRVEQRISRIDIRPFIRRQTVCTTSPGAGAIWQPVIEERYVSISDVTTSLFPQVTIDEDNPLFGQLGMILDERLIYHLIARRYRPVRPTSLNLSMTTLFDRLFDSFASSISDGARAAFAVELDCREILRDVGRMHAAFARLRQAGFGIVIDGLQLELLPYLRASRFSCDYVKIRLPSIDVAQCLTPACLKALKSLPREKIVFTRCDTQAALDIGRSLGITMFQGSIVDAQAGQQ